MMAKQESNRARIVLFGLDDALAAELQEVLLRQEQEVHSDEFLLPSECLGLVRRLGADLVFCAAERERYLALLEAVAREMPDLPVVIVSRYPEVSEWLDAMEAGASDYCAAPFETSHVQWILDSTLKHRSAPELYRAAG